MEYHANGLQTVTVTLITLAVERPSNLSRVVVVTTALVATRRLLATTIDADIHYVRVYSHFRRSSSLSLSLSLSLSAHRLQ